MSKYFAYGSNMDPDRIKYRLGYLPESECGILEGYRLEFNKIAAAGPLGMGYANIVSDQKEKVEGIIFDINDDDFDVLDGYEGVPDNYIRLPVKINLRDGQCEAIGYIAIEKMTRQGLKPSREYLDHVLKGKRCLSDSYYEQLVGVVVLQ